ncbi:MAG: hypothetical protein LBI92_06865 [Azoarcus sp.]|jgi:hypothetical protein|nr:hypothetical protein [Azoarcus sp.]
MDYTPRQLNLFYREARAIEASRVADAIMAANAGFNGGKTAQQLLRALRGGK